MTCDQTRYRQCDNEVSCVSEGWAVAIAARKRLEKMETPTGDPLSMHLFPVRRLQSPTCILNFWFTGLHGPWLPTWREDGNPVSTSSRQEAVTTKGFMLQAAPLTASKVARRYRTNRALLQVTRTHRKFNAWWWLVSLEGLLHIHYILQLLRFLHDLPSLCRFRDFHITKRLIAPSCILSPIYFFSCSITAGALIVRSLKNSRPSPPCLSILASSRERDHSRVLT